MSSFTMRRRVAASTTILMFCAAGWAALGAITGSHQAAAASVEPSAAAIAHYGIFRRAAVQSDALPAVNLQQVMALGGGTDGMTRRQPIAYPAYSQWATIEGDEVCVVDRFTPTFSPNGAPDTSGTCNSAEYLDRHHELLIQASIMGGTSSTPPTPGLANLITGLVPDGIAAVNLAFTDGTHEAVPIVENGFAYSLGNQLKTLATVTWTDSSGATFAETK